MFDVETARRIAGANPEHLPKLLVHTRGWNKEPMVDSKNRIHCNTAQAADLQQFLPLVFVGNMPNRPGVEIWRIALEAHHLEGSARDRIAPAATPGQRLQRVRAATRSTRGRS